MNIYNGNLDEISTEQVIVTDRDIYRKLGNINGSYDLYMLSKLNNKFVWEKMYENKDLNGSQIENIDRLSYTIENTVIKDDEKYTFMTIYKVDEKNTLTHTATFDGSYDITLYWKNLSSELNIRLINKYVTSKTLKDIPTHIDLIKECSYPSDCPDPSFSLDPYDIIDDFEPLQGWDIPIQANDWTNVESHDQTNVESHDQPNVESHVTGGCHSEVDLEEKYEEERIDPYDGLWYTESNFVNYYGGRTEWDHQNPKKILLREEYYKFTNIHSNLEINKFIFLFKKYEKTFQ
jgi:hypothetical protein